jgi:hypothetical protein
MSTEPKPFRRQSPEYTKGDLDLFTYLRDKVTEGDRNGFFRYDLALNPTAAITADLIDKKLDNADDGDLSDFFRTATEILSANITSGAARAKLIELRADAEQKQSGNTLLKSILSSIPPENHELGELLLAEATDRANYGQIGTEAYETYQAKVEPAFRRAIDFMRTGIEVLPDPELQ